MSLIYNCYNCNRPMTAKEVEGGVVALQRAYFDYEDFEGWVHCSGSESQFLDPQRDALIIEKIHKYEGLSESDVNIDDSIIVCTQCVTSQIKSEGCTKYEEEDEE